MNENTVVKEELDLFEVSFVSFAFKGKSSVTF